MKCSNASFFLALFLMLVQMTAFAEGAETPGPPTRVSMVRLIAEPEKYNGRLVIVNGVFMIATEESALYLSPSDADGGNVLNSLLLDFGQQKQKYEARKHQLNSKWVSVEGTFDMKTPEFWGNIVSGGIRNITEINLLGHFEPTIKAYGEHLSLPTVVIPDQETAIAMACAIWKPIFGGAEIKRQEPITAELRDGVWSVRGTLPAGSARGTALWAAIRQKNAEVLLVAPAAAPKD